MKRKINFEQKLLKCGVEIEHRYKEIRLFYGSQSYTIYKKETIKPQSYNKEFESIYNTLFKKGK